MAAVQSLNMGGASLCPGSPALIFVVLQEHQNTRKAKKQRLATMGLSQHRGAEHTGWPPAGEPQTKCRGAQGLSTDGLTLGLPLRGAWAGCKMSGAWCCAEFVPLKTRAGSKGCSVRRTKRAPHTTKLLLVYILRGPVPKFSVPFEEASNSCLLHILSLLSIIPKNDNQKVRLKSPKAKYKGPLLAFSTPLFGLEVGPGPSNCRTPQSAVP